LETARVDSALKGIEDNIDLAAKMNADADELWGREQYDQALELYDRAAKISPLKDRSAYFAKESALAKRDQEQFKRFYIVQKDDTLESVAQRANISELRIINANGPKYTALYQGRLIKGMQLALPVSIKRGQQSR